MRRAVFVDHDGVICQNRRDHVRSWEEFRFLPGPLDALVRLSQPELSVVVITDQAAINRGIVSEECDYRYHGWTSSSVFPSLSGADWSRP